MTTGRINQVTTNSVLAFLEMQRTIITTKLLSRSGVHYMINNSVVTSKTVPQLRTSDLKPTTKPPCSPISQISDRCSLLLSNRDDGLLRELPTTSYVMQTLQNAMRILKWLIATGLAIRK